MSSALQATKQRPRTGVGAAGLRVVLALLAAASGLAGAGGVAWGAEPVGKPASAAAGPADRGAPDEPTEARRMEQLDIELLLSLVRDPKLDAARRRRAVESLLFRESPQVVAELSADLAAGGDRATQQVIATAIGDIPEPPPWELYRPLLALLLQVEDPLQSDVARAVGRFQGPSFAATLSDLATDAGKTPAQRRGAVLALGNHRTKPAAAALIGLLKPRTEAPVREAALASLQQLTGIGDFRGDAARWERWWRLQQGLSDEEWHVRLLESFARRNERVERERISVEERLIAVQRQAYLASDKAAQPALLTACLRDELPAVRLLGLKLASERLVGGESLTDEIKQAIRERLDDESAEVRLRTAVLLREPELATTAAAEAVARKLNDGAEHRPALLRAYLQMLAVQPQTRALSRGVQYLGSPELQAEAAAYLAALAGTRPPMLEAHQLDLLRAEARRQIDRSPTPLANLVLLLARVADERDWARIEPWLGSEDAALQGAAARAWAESERSLDALAARGASPVIQPILIAAAERRGKTPATLAGLIEHRPAAAQAAEAWGRAVVALCGRVPVGEVLKAAQRVEELWKEPALREQMLTAALTSSEAAAPNTPEAMQTRALLLARAAARLAKPDPQAALKDYLRVESLSPSPDAQRDEARVGVLQARLAMGETEAAHTLTQTLLSEAGANPQAQAALRGRVAEAWLGAANRSLSTGEVARAEALAGLLRKLLNGVRDEWVVRLDALDAAITKRKAEDAARKPPEPPVAPPVAPSVKPAAS